MTCTLCFAKKSGRSWYFLFATMMVRLERTMISFTSVFRISSTNHLKLGCISGAPPVKSTVSMELFFITFKHSSKVIWVIISFRSGPASTWQWAQTWLHIYPRLICSTAKASGCNPCGKVAFIFFSKIGRRPSAKMPLDKISNCFSVEDKLFPLAFRDFFILHAELIVPIHHLYAMYKGRTTFYGGGNVNGFHHFFFFNAPLKPIFGIGVNTIRTMYSMGNSKCD